MGPRKPGVEHTTIPNEENMNLRDLYLARLPNTLAAIGSGELVDPQLLFVGPGNYDEVMDLQYALFGLLADGVNPQPLTHVVDRPDSDERIPGQRPLKVNWIKTHRFDFLENPGELINLLGEIKPALTVFRHPYVGFETKDGEHIDFKKTDAMLRLYDQLLDRLDQGSGAMFFSVRPEDLAVVREVLPHSQGHVLSNLELVSGLEGYVYTRDGLLVPGDAEP